MEERGANSEMKVDMSRLMEEEDAAKKAPSMQEADDSGKEAQAEEVDTEEDSEDESDSHSKLKTALLIAAMVGGFALFVWNMTGLVNNLRLDNQGSATNIVYDVEDLSSFMDMSGSGSVPVDESTMESEVSTDAARDGPSASALEPDNVQADTDTGSESDSELAKERDEALNEKALTERELEQAAEMLDASLIREDKFKEYCESHGIDWHGILNGTESENGQ